MAIKNELMAIVKDNYAASEDKRITAGEKLKVVGFVPARNFEILAICARGREFILVNLNKLEVDI